MSHLHLQGRVHLTIAALKKTNSKTVKFDSEPRVTAEGTKLKTSDSHNGDMISNTCH